MLENTVPVLFAIAFILCVVSGQSVVIALFLWHGSHKGFSAGELARMCLA